jgi:hypothetical protein
LVTITTDIPKAKVFRFENYWMNHDDFMRVLNHGRNVTQSGKAMRLMEKFKNLRRVLRLWHTRPSNLAATITNNKLVLQFLDVLEEFRHLSLEEWNFRTILHDNLSKLLEQWRIYWMQWGRIKWDTLGDENTKFFHANATIRHNKNSIMALKDSNGHDKSKHEDKASIFWDSYKERLGTKEFTQMHFDLRTLVHNVENHDVLTLPFSNEDIANIMVLTHILWKIVGMSSLKIFMSYVLVFITIRYAYKA